MPATNDAIGIPGSTIRRQVAWLALPVVVEQLLLYLVGLSDTILTGRYFSAEELAAVTVAEYLTWFVGSLFAVVSVGATAVVARLCGANRREDASRMSQQAVLLASLAGVAVLLAGWSLAEVVVGWLNLRGRAAIAASRYLTIVLTALPLLACTNAGVACLRGAGDTRTGMRVMMVVNAINVGLSWSLVVGYGPFPRIGFEGIAVGTAVAQGVGGMLVLGVLARGRSGLRLSPTGVAPHWPDIRRMLRVGVPAAAESLTNVVGQLWFLGVINRLGAVATAAHGVAIRCESVAFLTITAFAVAASTLTGQYLGAGRPESARRASLVAWRLGTLVLGVLGIAIYVLARPMFALFLGSAPSEVTSVGVPVLRLVVFALPALATINVLSGTLRGAGDTRWPWAIALLGYAGVRLPLAYLLTAPASQGGWGWGLYGAWVAMFIDLYLRGLMIAVRFLQGGWTRASV